MTTLVKAWTGAQQRLKAAGVDSPAIDVCLLFEAAVGVTRTEVITDPHHKVAPDQQAILDGYVERRARREPVSRILGRKGFWKLLLTVSPHVLTPRPDTETIVELALRAFPETAAFHMADLGVGSGAMLLAILAERPAARGIGTDVSEEALAVAKDNAANLDLEGRATFLRTDWGEGMPDASFDLIVSNPPYIRSAEIPTLDPEVKDHELLLVFVGGFV